MTNQQHHAQFDWATELSDAQGHVTLSEQEAHEIGARLRRLHSENETLQAGYAAARLEIESLQARIKTIAEEHADELMLAHLDGRMRAAQPAPQQEVQEPVAWYVTGCGRLLDEDEAKAEARHIGGTARAMPLYTAPQADSVLEDAARLDWLDKNIFYRDMSEWDAKYGHGSGYNMWVLFAPKGHQGSARNIIDAARKQGANHD